MTRPEVIDNLTKYLESCPNVVDIKPVSVKLGKAQYFGCFYRSRHYYMPQERAVTDKLVEAGEERFENRIYLLGERPKVRKRTCYVWDNSLLPIDARVHRRVGDWYICCYLDLEGYKKNPSIHPFGLNFILSEYLVQKHGHYADWTIDTGEKTPRDRLPLTVDYI